MTVGPMSCAGMRSGIQDVVLLGLSESQALASVMHDALRVIAASRR
jgi:hypothetical protein